MNRFILAVCCLALSLPGNALADWNHKAIADAMTDVVKNYVYAIDIETNNTFIAIECNPVNSMLYSENFDGKNSGSVVSAVALRIDKNEPFYLYPLHSDPVIIAIQRQGRGNSTIDYSDIVQQMRKGNQLLLEIVYKDFLYKETLKFSLKNFTRSYANGCSNQPFYVQP